MADLWGDSDDEVDGAFLAEVSRLERSAGRTAPLPQQQQQPPGDKRPRSLAFPQVCVWGGSEFKLQKPPNAELQTKPWPAVL